MIPAACGLCQSNRGKGSSAVSKPNLVRRDLAWGLHIDYGRVKECLLKSGAKVNYRTYLADAFEWLEARDENSIHAIVTDPPYGLKEYTDIEKAKLRNGRGGCLAHTAGIRRLQAKPATKVHGAG